jgi:hypothetical protein
LAEREVRGFRRFSAIIHFKPGLLLKQNQRFRQVPTSRPTLVEIISD